MIKWEFKNYSSILNAKLPIRTLWQVAPQSLPANPILGVR